MAVVACLFLVSCSKTWPETVADLDDTWPLPETEAEALRSLVGSSMLSPKRFAIWKERKEIDSALENGAVIRKGHVVELIFKSSSLKTLAPVAALPHLVSLKVSHNALSALEGIAKLTRLQTIEAWDNPIVRVAPLAALTSLKSLILADTQLDSVASLGDLPMGLTLTVGGKALRHIAAKSSQASGVTVLNIYRSPNLRRLAGIETHLKLTSLTLFKATGLMNLAGLAATKHLRQLDLGSLALPLLSDLAGCNSLKKLKISYCKTLKLSSLPSLPALEDLEVREVAPGVFGLPRLPSLKRLNVIGMSITSLSGFAGENLSNLQRVFFGWTKLSHLDARGSFAKVRYLEIKNSELTSLRGLGAFPNLETLKIDHSKISSLGHELAAPFVAGPAEAEPASSSAKRVASRSTKRVASRSTTSFASGPASRNSVRKLAHLHTIWIQHSEVVTLKGLSEAVPNLARLNVEHNHLASLMGLEGAKKLRNVDASFNALTTLASLRGLSLSSFHAYKNRLESAAPVVVKGQALKGLVYYDLRKNPLKDLPESDRLYDAEASVRSGSPGSRYSGGGGYHSGK